ncbi:hypothetical protein A9Q84_00820 [Halobacteriovorax marinus]|uniref:HTH tetR-type domain-containing protein n=1 Tax=Halobacteriovorax marinus TaxID=97084 RepID=A0A1Y5FHD3_9BACT|nr:hypothetical protein A9Q84_00820 [Halobacteriovorax marinus]
MESTSTAKNEIDPLLYDLFEFRPRKGDLKKVEIIKASIECLATLGIEKTSYEAIAKVIGTRRAHVAYHFADKHEIFKSAIKYILATYQQMSLEHIAKATSGEDMLIKYVEAAFSWADLHPKQVSVILLLYYFCSIDEDYLELNDRVKKKGQERIYFILKAQMKKNFTSEKAKALSSIIQNLTSSTIQDCYTTKDYSLKTGKENVLSIIKTLVETY